MVLVSSMQVQDYKQNLFVTFPYQVKIYCAQYRNATFNGEFKLLVLNQFISCLLYDTPQVLPVNGRWRFWL